MMSDSAKSTLVMAAALLMASYFYLNAYKIGMVADYFEDVAAGASPAIAQLYIGNKKIIDHKIENSGFFDRDGSRQISFIRLSAEQLQQLAANAGKSTIKIANQQVPLQKISKGDIFQAVLPQYRLYLLPEGDWPTMANLLLLEKKKTKGLVKCITPEVCQALAKIDGEWGPVGGPYHDYALSSVRRGLPKGRWLYGPETKVVFHAQRPVKVAVLLTMLGVAPDQRVGFVGSESRAKAVPVKEPMIKLAGKKYYPNAAVVELNLQQGPNELDIKFSKWGLLVSGKRQPFAAYITGLTIKEIN